MNANHPITSPLTPLGEDEITESRVGQSATKISFKTAYGWKDKTGVCIAVETNFRVVCFSGF